MAIDRSPATTLSHLFFFPQQSLKNTHVHRTWASPCNGGLVGIGHLLAVDPEAAAPRGGAIAES